MKYSGSGKECSNAWEGLAKNASKYYRVWLRVQQSMQLEHLGGPAHIGILTFQSPSWSTVWGAQLVYL